MPGSAGTAGFPGTSAGMPGNSGSSTGSGTDVAGRNGSGSTNGGGSTSGASAGGTNGPNGGASGANGSGGIAYGTGDDPFADLGRPGGTGTSAAERRAALDARLEESYAVFDGMIISEREKAQNEANSAGSEVMGTGAGGQGGQGGTGDSGDGMPGTSSVIVARAPDGSAGGGYMPGGAAARQGENSNQNQPSFPPPGDIPSGNDDDVVARQLREAALHEPDAELREKLWDEYRKYTGLPVPSAQ